MKIEIEATSLRLEEKSRNERAKGDFIFRVRNSEGEEGEIRVDSEVFESHSPAGKVLFLHESGRDITKGKPFDILSRSWTNSIR